MKFFNVAYATIVQIVSTIRQSCLTHLSRIQIKTNLLARPPVQAKTNSRPSSKDQQLRRILYLAYFSVGYSGNYSMSYPTNIKSNVLQQLTQWLFEPSPQITIASQRRHARLLSSLLIFALGMVCITIVSERVYAAVITLIILGTGYGFSRTRHYEWGALLAVFALMIPSFAMILDAAPGTLDDTYLAASPLSWLILALILASLWAKAWITAVVTIITIGATLGLPVVRPEINMEAIRWMVALFGVSGGFLVLAAALRNRDSKDIETQTRALEDQHQRLQASEQRYRGLVENISDTVYMIDTNGYFTYVSPAGSTLTGYALESLKGMHFLHLVDPEWRSVLVNFYQDQIANREDETKLDFPLITAAGEKRWVEQKTALILDEKQALIGLQS
ncbi:MAG: PAS domain S-box protein, partial [Anaerolineae bacterium]|nr:PAS domain S-box protein [Anaerolineae bacterium]